MYYILYGEDELSRTEHARTLRAPMSDPQFADLNTTLLDGRTVSLSELKHACDAIPFLTAERLVIVTDLLARLNPRQPKKGADEIAAEEEINPDLAKGLREYLPQVPASTRLIFIETKPLAKNNPTLKQALQDVVAKRAQVHEFPAPAEKTLPHWIEQRTRAKGGTIEPAAAHALALHGGNDLRLLDNEIEKLLTYRANQTIRIEDVHTLVANVHEADIFALVDAIGRRERAAALKLLHAQLAQNAAPLYLLTMITRQFRLLVQIKDLALRGISVDAAAEKAKLHPFVVKKTWAQAGAFSPAQLTAIYDRLLDTDLAIKTSRADPALALDLLVVDLTR